MQDSLFSPLIEQAIELAAEWHAGTFRKGRWRNPSFSLPDGGASRVPVISHVTAVGLTIQRAGWDDHTVAAAFLHDILEDPNQLGQIMSFDRLVELMGEVVAQRVLEVSEKKKDAQGTPQKWEARKVGYIEGLLQHSVEAAAISLADKIHNLWSMNKTIELGIDVFTTSEERRGLSAGPDQQRWFYDAVYKATLHHQDKRLAPLQQIFQKELNRFIELTERKAFVD